ncbi:hypothetical protein FB451DRAFT_1257239 [Mycena latifolia]|nr:hypothetical protein FB451DRAFT_1257239 [Mycena latifolia]
MMRTPMTRNPFMARSAMTTGDILLLLLLLDAVSPDAANTELPPPEAMAPTGSVPNAPLADGIAFEQVLEPEMSSPVETKYVHRL